MHNLFPFGLLYSVPSKLIGDIRGKSVAIMKPTAFLFATNSRLRFWLSFLISSYDISSCVVVHEPSVRLISQMTSTIGSTRDILQQWMGFFVQFHLTHWTIEIKGQQMRKNIDTVRSNVSNNINETMSQTIVKSWNAAFNGPNGSEHDSWTSFSISCG